MLAFRCSPAQYPRTRVSVANRIQSSAVGSFLRVELYQYSPPLSHHFELDDAL